jgi:hypothetical protein
MEWITVIAIAFSPLIAVLVSIWVQDRKERRQHKLNILGTLIGGRHDPLALENVRALNVIDLVFHDQAKVRSLWREYFDMLCNEGLNNENGWAQRNKKRNELITEMAAGLGYRKAISHLDVDRVYVPVGVADNAAKAQELMQELLRVLKSTDSLAMRRRRPTGSGTEASNQPLQTDRPSGGG